MSTLEQEILEKFALLDDEAKSRVLRRLEKEAVSKFNSNSEWLKAVKGLNQEFQHKVGKLPQGTIQSMLDETRDDL